MLDLRILSRTAEENASRAAWGIPRIIHQTWHSTEVDEDKGDPKSWRRLNPGWEYRFWTDAALLDFMQRHFPDYVDIYQSYPRAVQRIDLARYCLLKHFGGLYADIDTRCLAPVEPLAGCPRVVLCEEPPERQEPARRRGLGSLLFNGCMASPPGHALWDDVLELCRRMSPFRDGDVLETTGPLVLTAAVRRHARPETLSLNSSHLFLGPAGGDQSPGNERMGEWGHLSLSEHFWLGSWFRVRRPNLVRQAVARLRERRHAITSRRHLSLETVRESLDLVQFHRPPARRDAQAQVAVVIMHGEPQRGPVQTLAAISGLQHPHHHLHLLVGCPSDDEKAPDQIAELARQQGESFACLRAIIDTPPSDQARAGRRKAQPDRPDIARRNRLLAVALTLPVDWILWLDSAVVSLPGDLIERLLGTGARIVAPNCIRVPDGSGGDPRTFVTVADPGLVDYQRYLRGGLFCPPPDFWARRSLSALRYLDQVPLDGVGGAALMVDAGLHRAGLTFPERPYRDLIGTEGFASLARDLGETPIGLPQLEVGLRTP